MRKLFIITILLTTAVQAAYPQSDTLKGEAAKKIIRQIKIDTARFLNNVSHDACKCVDSIQLSGKSSKEISAEIFTCIDKSVVTYQLLLKTYHSMIDPGDNYVINLNSDKNSAEYKLYYFEIERWLTDSCSSIKTAAASDNKESENSTSKDKTALGYYDNGVKILSTDNYKDALPWFEKAVKQDENFAFAWDNIGICKRRIGDLDGALAAYNKSLHVDPKGKVPLENIPVVYEHKKDYDNAIEAYKNLSKIYPDDPEAYYGTGRMYELKGDLEKALDYMCKAYNAYIALNSPYRTDAEKNINIYYKRLKDLGKEDQFFSILKDNHISTK